MFNRGNAITIFVGVSSRYGAAAMDIKLLLHMKLETRENHKRGAPTKRTLQIGERFVGARRSRLGHLKGAYRKTPNAYGGSPAGARRQGRHGLGPWGPGHKKTRLARGKPGHAIACPETTDWENKVSPPTPRSPATGSIMWSRTPCLCNLRSRSRHGHKINTGTRTGHKIKTSVTRKSSWVITPRPIANTPNMPRTLMVLGIPRQRKRCPGFEC